MPMTTVVQLLKATIRTIRLLVVMLSATQDLINFLFRACILSKLDALAMHRAGAGF